MPFDNEIGLAADGGHLFGRKTHLNFDYAVALGAGEVMVMRAAANAKMVGAIGKFDAVQQPQADQFLYCSIDSCPSQARLVSAQVVPEIINGEVLATFGQLNEALRDKAARTSIALPALLERGSNGICDHGFGLVAPLFHKKTSPTGIEPARMASEATALSTELRGLQYGSYHTRQLNSILERAFSIDNYRSTRYATPR